MRLVWCMVCAGVVALLGAWATSSWAFGLAVAVTFVCAFVAYGVALFPEREAWWRDERHKEWRSRW